jgi:hypothetical protein
MIQITSRKTSNWQSLETDSTSRLFLEFLQVS